MSPVFISEQETEVSVLSMLTFSQYQLSWHLVMAIQLLPVGLCSAFSFWMQPFPWRRHCLQMCSYFYCCRLPFCHFIHSISISPLHLLISQRAIKAFEVKGVLSRFIHLYHTFLFFCSEWLPFNTEEDMNLSWTEEKSLLEKNSWGIQHMFRSHNLL